MNDEKIRPGIDPCPYCGAEPLPLKAGPRIAFSETDHVAYTMCCNRQHTPNIEEENGTKEDFARIQAAGEDALRHLESVS